MDNQALKTREFDEIKFFGAVLLVLVILLFVSVVVGTKVKRDGTSVPGATAMQVFPEVNIEARAAYIYDARTKTVVYAKNENERLSLASLTKIMTALVASEQTPLYSTVTIDREALMAEGDSGLYVGEKWSLNNLLDFSLVTSSNDGMRAVALALGAVSRSTVTGNEMVNDFVQEMNKKAGGLDLKNTYFFNATGLDETDYKGGAYGSARDVVTLFEYILTYRSELLEATKQANSTIYSENNIAHKAKNTDILVDEIPGLIASKTGYTDMGGGNLVIAFDPELGRPIIISVLGSSADGRFDDMRTLINATMAYITGENF
ncbi:MAG: hypothetical protein ABIF06_00895 [bacterium]